MKRRNIMLIAGDPSGDAHAADLVRALAVAVPDAQFQVTREAQPLTTPLAPAFFGAGGPAMAAAGVNLAFDLTADSVIGPGDLLKKLPLLARRLRALVQMAVERQPDIIILVDYGEFNLRFARTIRNYLRARSGPFFNWRPRLVGFISPQVWASRPRRARKMARDYDLLLSLFPFEKKWYAEHAPRLPVEFVGHPILDWCPPALRPRAGHPVEPSPSVVLLLPGSRAGELKRHLPVLFGAARLIAAQQAAQFKMALPNASLAAVARSFALDAPVPVDIQIGGLAQALATATIAITKTGTITMECAYFGVPAVALYKTSPATYLLGRYFWPLKVHVKYFSMPNLLAGEALYPEFIQGAATQENIAAAALELLGSPARRDEIRAKLDAVVQSLGGPGAARRAAAAILQLTSSATRSDAPG